MVRSTTFSKTLLAFCILPTVVVTGSIYLIGEVFERIEPGRGAGEGRLQDF